jgi:hypothetical protein
LPRNIFLERSESFENQHVPSRRVVASALRLMMVNFQRKEEQAMKKFLTAVVSVSAFVILVGAATAQMEHGSGHDTHGTKEQPGKAGQHEMMKNHMSKAGHHEMMKTHMSKAGEHGMMKGHMGKAGHDMKSQMGKSGHDMKSHADKPGHQ